MASRAQFHNKPHGERLSILLAEDDPLIAMELESELQSLGLDVIGPFRTVETACSTIAETQPDLALLDVNLVDGDVYPAADALYRKGVPMIFHTGSNDSQKIAGRYSGSKVIAKPADWGVLRGELQASLRRLKKAH